MAIVAEVVFICLPILFYFSFLLSQIANSVIICTFASLSPFSAGLKLRRQATGKDEDCGSFSYALSPLTVAPKDIDWKIIAPSGADIVCDHIHCHEIKPDDNLDMLIAECRANHAVAVVLVNCDDNYSLPETVQSSFNKTDYLVLVLTANDGKKLLQTLLEEDDDGDFQAKILEKEPAERVPGVSKQVDLQPCK